MSDEKRTVVRDTLASIYARKGTLTAKDVVRAAKNPDSPLHKHFNWDDGVAAAKWRLHQARNLINKVWVSFRTDTVVFDAPAYVRNPDTVPTHQGYISVADITGDRDASFRALQYECARASACLERARKYALAVGMASDVEAVLEGLGAIRERIAA